MMTLRTGRFYSHVSLRDSCSGLHPRQTSVSRSVDDIINDYVKLPYCTVRIPPDEPPPPPAPPQPSDDELELERDLKYFVEPDEAMAPRTGDLES
jgi:hypothetical protein